MCFMLFMVYYMRFILVARKYAFSMNDANPKASMPAFETEGAKTADLAERSVNVPRFKGDASTNTPKVAVVIPVLNEEDAIGLVLDEIPVDWVRHVIVVDNGSTDGTVQRAHDHGACVVSEPRRGYGAACLKGLSVLPDETAVVVFLDGDHSDYPEELPKLVEPLLKGEADLIIGSRALGGAERGALFPQQRFGNWIATTLIRWLTGTRYTDLGPFRAITRKALETVAMADQAFGWTVEMQLKAPKCGLRVREISVRYRKRIGVSKISGTVVGGAKAGWTILSTIWTYRNSRRDPVEKPEKS